MLITNIYRSGENDAVGFVADTEKRTYKPFSLNASDWLIAEDYRCVTGFKIAGDIVYRFLTKAELDVTRFQYIQECFTEDPSMVLDFGAFTR